MLAAEIVAPIQDHELRAHRHNRRLLEPLQGLELLAAFTDTNFTRSSKTAYEKMLKSSMTKESENSQTCPLKLKGRPTISSETNMGSSSTLTT